MTELQNQELIDAIVDFNGKSSITRDEFKAWLVGYLSGIAIEELSIEGIGEIIGMVMKIQDETKYVPSPPLFPPTQPITPTNPWTTPPNAPSPQYPPLRPFWCDKTSSPSLDTQYKFTSSDTGHNNGS